MWKTMAEFHMGHLRGDLHLDHFGVYARYVLQNNFHGTFQCILDIWPGV